MSGEAELYYGIIITGLCVPPFVHYAMKFIRKGLPGARRDLVAMKIAARADLERTKKLLRAGKADCDRTMSSVRVSVPPLSTEDGQWNRHHSAPDSLQDTLEEVDMTKEDHDA